MRLARRYWAGQSINRAQTLFQICVVDELLNGITGIVNRREVLKEYFLKNEINVIEVEHTLCLWKKWKTVIIDRYTQGGEVLTGKDFDFNKIVDSEEKPVPEIVILTMGLVKGIGERFYECM